MKTCLFNILFFLKKWNFYQKQKILIKYSLAIYNKLRFKVEKLLLLLYFNQLNYFIYKKLDLKIIFYDLKYKIFLIWILAKNEKYKYK